MRNGGLPILDMHQDETSLEQVFLAPDQRRGGGAAAKKRRGFRSSKGGQPEETAVAIVPAQEETHKEVSDQ